MLSRICLQKRLWPFSLASSLSLKRSRNLALPRAFKPYVFKPIHLSICVPQINTPQQTKKRVIGLTENLLQMQLDMGLDINPKDYMRNVNFGLVEVVYEWARGMVSLDLLLRICSHSLVPVVAFLRHHAADGCGRRIYRADDNKA